MWQNFIQIGRDKGQGTRDKFDLGYCVDAFSLLPYALSLFPYI
jgi:hypothetical protein